MRDELSQLLPTDLTSIMIDYHSFNRKKESAEDIEKRRSNRYIHDLNVLAHALAAAHALATTASKLRMGYVPPRYMGNCASDSEPYVRIDVFVWQQHRKQLNAFRHAFHNYVCKVYTYYKYTK
jgi:hypothetical protein